MSAIKSQADYNEISELADIGEDRLICGSGESGVHYYIMHVLQSKYGIFVITREDAIKAAKKLCRAYLENEYEKYAMIGDNE